MSKVESLNRMLNPNSIAIVGVSQDFTSIGGKPLKNLIRHTFQGEIYPVNPKYKELGGYPCYPSLLDVPGEIDVALLAVSQKRILQVMKDCAEKGINNVILFGSGFAETGEDGQRVQEELLKFARQNDIHILGPNCIGGLNVIKQIPMGFATSFETDKEFVKGNVGLVSQSGALGFSVFGLAQDENIGFSYVVNTGNQIDINTLDCISFMLENDSTDVIAVYLEGVPDGEQLIDLAKRAKELKKPLIVLKAGRSDIGKKAALSHTASVTGSEETFQAIVKQYGIIQVNDIDDMIDAIKIFTSGKTAQGPNVAAVTNSGASGIAMADYSESLGLELLRLSDETNRKITSVIPPYGSSLNPIDITAQALKEQHVLTETLEILVNDEQVDVIVVQTTFGGTLGKKICEKIVGIDEKTSKPIVITLTGTEELTGEGRAILQTQGIPVYMTSYKTMTAVKHLVNFSDFCKRTDVDSQVAVNHATEGQRMATGIWTEEKVKKQLSDLGIRVPEGLLIENKVQLNQIKEKINYPVVCKIISDDVLHKTDAGGIVVDVKDADELSESYEKILHSVKLHQPDAKIRGVLAEEMVDAKGVEMFIGVKKDPQFGPLIVCGLGGIFVEVLKDTSIRHAPIGVGEAYRMLEELKGYPLLLGARGGEKGDIDTLAHTLARISHFAYENKGNLEEMDINPLLVLEDGKGVVALDGIISWEKRMPEPST